jgi:hypothetical protein
MTLKDEVELVVFPPLVLEKVMLWELYAVSRGTGLGGAPEDEVVLHENVVVAVEVAEVEELFEVELEAEVEAVELELLVEDGDKVLEELDFVVDAVVMEEEFEEDEGDEVPLFSAKYAAAPPMATTTITTTAITAVETPRLRLVIIFMTL